MCGHNRDYLFHFRQQFTTTRHGHKRPILLRLPNLILRIETYGIQTTVRSRLEHDHPLHPAGSHATGTIQIDTAKRLETRSSLPGKNTPKPRRLLVIFFSTSPRIPRDFASFAN